MKKHDWRERDEDGSLIFYRATFHGTIWKLFSHPKGEEEWQPHDPMTLEELRMVRDVLWRKYQRRRCPWEEVDRFDKFIEEAEEERAEREAAERARAEAAADAPDEGDEA